jgi:DNA-binding transcriptional LysR family regulator
VATELHFRRAAEALHIAQPALSRQIQALEQQLGAQLLERDRRTVTLTDAGRTLLEDAVPLLAAADATRRRVQQAARGTGALVVGFRTGIIPTAAVRAFAAAHPDVAVETKRLEWDDQEQNVLTGCVDVAYVRRPVDDRALKLVPLFTEPRLAALPADHPLATRAELTLAELADERQLRYMESVKTGPNRTTVLRSVEEKLEKVAGGVGIIILPRSATRFYSRPDIVYVPVVDAEPDEVLLATEASCRSPLVAAFVEAALEVRLASPEYRGLPRVIEG